MCKNPSDGYDPVFILNGYVCVSNNKGRGTVLFIRNNLEYDILSQYEDTFSPSTICKIKLNKENSFILGVLYRSPSCTEEESLNVNKLINQISDKYFRQKIVLIGDFNYRDIDWKNDSSDKNDSHITTVFRHFT